MKNKHLNVFIADDHQIFNDAMRTLLNEQEHITVVDSATNGKDTLEKIRTLEIDLIIMDINMEPIDGLTATKTIKTDLPHIKVLLLTMHNQPAYIEQLKHTPADGYILKDAGKSELMKAIETIMNGQPYYSPVVVHQLLNQYRKESSESGELRLTTREKEVLQLILNEKTTRQIAEQLYISEQTVLTHRKNLHRKFDVHNTAGLVKKAIQMGMG